MLRELLASRKAPKVVEEPKVEKKPRKKKEDK